MILGVVACFAICALGFGDTKIQGLLLSLDERFDWKNSLKVIPQQ
jgi:hypothetical protein